MTLLNGFIIVLGMFMVTFGVRFALFARASKFQMPDWAERALTFVPVAVLTAIISPMIFMTDSELDVSLSNPWLLASLVCLFIGLWRQQQLLTICTGEVVFFIGKFFLN